MSTRSLPLLLAFFSVSVLSACVSTIHTDTAIIYERTPSHQIVVEEATVAWKHQEVVGAAYSEAGYRLVLGQPTLIMLSDFTSLPISDVNVEELITPASYSIYEMTRWERFCGKGKMNEHDWKFVATQGRNNLPSSFEKDCHPPAYTRSQYLTAWRCDDSALLQSERIIRTLTVSPKRQCP